MQSSVAAVKLMGVVRLLLIIIQLIYVSIYLKTIVSMCKHCWQLITRYDYKKLIGESCLDLSVKLLMKCVQCIANKMMKCLRDNNANLQQEEDTYGIISTPIQETDEQ